MANNTTLLGALFSEEPDRAALISPGGPVLSYGSLRREVEALAALMQGAGLSRDDRIAIVLPNGLEMVVAFLAAATAATAAPLNPGYRFEEFQFYMADTGARALIVPVGGAEDARRAAPSGTLLIETRLDPSGGVRFQPAGRVSPRGTVSPGGPDDVALVLHTSGTTSRPKRVPLKQRNVTISARNIALAYALGPDDVSLCVMPLFHVHGLVGSTLSTLVSGGTVIVPPGFNALSFWPTVQGYRVTWYSAVPTIQQMLLARARTGIRPSGADGLRFVRSCSSALAPATLSELEKNFGAPVLEAYGMTEGAHQIATNPLPPGVRKPGSVGRGSNVEIGIMDKDGNLLHTGAQGEVVIQGANVISGYEDNPAANASSFTHGWFRTGDEGVLDAEGYLTLVGRIKELIVRGGEKISPREIDEVLARHPAVSEVAAFGVPHRIYGEEVAAAVSLRTPATEAELIRFCRDHLAEFKCPKKIHIMKSIPRTDTGKIQRRIVAERFQKTE